LQTGHCEKISVQGLVQGVGFRPTVWQLARQFNLTGEVFNDGQGVQIIAQSSPANLERFIEALRINCPPLARIDQVNRSACPDAPGYNSFTITGSQNTAVQTGIVADAATCPACQAEIRDPANRRFAYAFTNCTHCGPRLSIIKDIPYDRANTSMQAFKLCPSCELEYHTPSDRRFHAQPNACPDCGPRLELSDTRGQVVTVENAITATAGLLREGKIVAIKGIGGYQLACDASNDQAVIELRRRKRRPHKALALMARNLEQISTYCLMNQLDSDLLLSHEAPIVILNRRNNKEALSEHLAPGQHSLGFMLPYSPLHHLLMDQLDHPIVLTSGNYAEQPQCIDNAQASNQLAGCTDYFLHHDRDIINRVDDSVLRNIINQTQFYRRARGYAPAPITLPTQLQTGKQILACGAELKNTFALLKQGKITLSQHMGNLANNATYEDYLKNLDLYQRMYQFKADVVAVDKHPEYLSSKYGRRLAEDYHLTIIEVQHHHAHIAACLADNNWDEAQGKVIGVAMDGLGFGDDGTLWGGEFLLANYLDYQRVARLKPTPLPGGSACMLEPWRNTLAQLATHAGWLEVNHRFNSLELFQYLNAKPVETLLRMMDSSINSPLSSSCGRLFDAVSAAMGICRDRISYEGQAAIELEALIDQGKLDSYPPYPFELDQSDLLEINPAPMWKALLLDLSRHKSRSSMAGRFHQCIAHAIHAVVEGLRGQHGINTVALSGGVFQNPTLLKLVMDLLQRHEFIVLIQHQVPANDGCISLGQAAIAAAQTR